MRRRRPEEEITLVALGHALTEEQVCSIERMIGAPALRVLNAEMHVMLDRPLEQQVESVLDAIGIGAAEWIQAVIVLPTHPVLAAVVVAAVEGRAGALPVVVHRVCSGPAREWRLTEVIDLAAVRARARCRRTPPRQPPTEAWSS